MSNSETGHVIKSGDLYCHLDGLQPVFKEGIAGCFIFRPGDYNSAWNALEYAIIRATRFYEYQIQDFKNSKSSKERKIYKEALVRLEQLKAARAVPVTITITEV